MLYEGEKVLPTHTILSPGGAELAVDDTGGAGPVIVFSHGYMMSRHMFGPQVEHFRQQFRCITWDARGHRDTVWEGAFTYWDSARDMLSILDALNLDKVIHVGMSQGGLLGMRAALLAPERFYGLVQLSTQAGELPDSGDDTFVRLVNDWIANGPDQEKLDFLSSFILGPGTDHAYWHESWRSVSSAQLRDATGALMTIDPLWDRLHEVTVPVATIHGLADVATSHELGLRTPAGVPDPRGVTLIEGGPHAVNLSHPDQVNTAIAAFIDELAAENPELKGLGNGS